MEALCSIRRKLSQSIMSKYYNGQIFVAEKRNRATTKPNEAHSSFSVTAVYEIICLLMAYFYNYSLIVIVINGIKTKLIPFQSLFMSLFYFF